MGKQLGIVLMTIVMMASVVSPLFAQDLTPTASPSSVPQQISYDMPYPGLLPDNPLYMFKTLRDKIVSMLISDNKKRVEFDLLNSDKRVVSGVALIQKGKYDLGVTTISKSNNYFYEALQAFDRANSMNEDTKLLALKLKDAAGKHLELLKGVEKKVPAASKSGFSKEETRLNDFLKQILKASE